MEHITVIELRKRMIEDMQLAGLSQGTQEAYVRVVRQLGQKGSSEFSGMGFGGTHEQAWAAVSGLFRHPAVDKLLDEAATPQGWVPSGYWGVVRAWIGDRQQRGILGVSGRGAGDSFLAS